jgi:hypothetical protein
MLDDPTEHSWTDVDRRRAATALRIGVVVASLGRPAECAQLLERLALQSLRPAAIILSVEKEADIAAPTPDSVEVVMGHRGLCAQRNRGVRAIADRCDVIVFFDDDYLPSRRALEGVSTLFLAHPDVVGATGEVLADGVQSGGLDLESALSIVERFDKAWRRVGTALKDVNAAYGCNMAFRVKPMMQVGFDESLPLYGWQEDVDFTGQISRFGRVVKTDAFSGVHRGVTAGRTSGLRLGFSQIVNPVYLVRKGTMRWSHAARLMCGNLMANHAKAFRPEPYIDRAGRARGNWIGLAHVLRGRPDPSRILELS